MKQQEYNYWSSVGMGIAIAISLILALTTLWLLFQNRTLINQSKKEAKKRIQIKRKSYLYKQISNFNEFVTNKTFQYESDEKPYKNGITLITILSRMPQDTHNKKNVYMLSKISGSLKEKFYSSILLSEAISLHGKLIKINIIDDEIEDWSKAEEFLTKLKNLIDRLDKLSTDWKGISDRYNSHRRNLSPKIQETINRLCKNLASFSPIFVYSVKK